MLNFVCARGLSNRSERESLMGEAAGLVRARRPPALARRGALDVWPIGRIANWTSPQAPEHPARQARLSLRLSARTRANAGVRPRRSLSRARARAGASPTSSYGGDDATPTMGEPLCRRHGRQGRRSFDRTNLQSVEKAADAAMRAREPLAALPGFERVRRTLRHPGGAAAPALTPVPAPGGHSPEQVHRTPATIDGGAGDDLLSSQAIAFAERATSLAALAGGDVSIRQQEQEHEHEHEHERELPRGARR